MKKIMNLPKPNSNVHYSVFNDKQERIITIRDAICYGSLCNNTSWINYAEVDDKIKYRPVKFLTTTIKHNGKDKNVTPLWIEYLTQTSPFRDAYVSECLPHVNDTMNLVIDLDKAANLVSNAAIATRFSHENSHTQNGRKGYLWYQLVKTGMDPDLAFMVAIKTANDYTHATGINGSISHSLVSQTNDEFVQRFLTDDKKLSAKTFSQKRCYYDTFRLFSKDNNQGNRKFQRLLTDIFNMPLGKQAGGYENPFAVQQSGSRKKLSDYVDQMTTELKGFNVNDFFKIKEKKSVAA